MLQNHAVAFAFVAFILVAPSLAQTPGNKDKKPQHQPLQQMPAASNGTFVLRGGRLLTITHGVIENGVLIIQNGKIAAVGSAGSTAVPAGAKVIDATGMTVYPGLIDSETHLGLTEISADRMTDDQLENSDEIMPHMHVYDAFHAETALIPVTRVNGITNAIVSPAVGDTLPGQDSFIQLAGRSASEMLMVRDIALPLNFTGRQRRNESFERAKFPQTRMGMAAQLRQAFLDAQDYEQKHADYEKKPSGDRRKERPKKDLKLEALLPYLHGQKPVVLAAEEPNDVETALDLANEFHLKVILNHLTHSASLLDKIAATGFPVIVGPIYEQPKESERYDAVFRLPAEMVKRGIKIAFASYDAHQARNLPYAAGYAVGFGLPYEEALKAITLNPAQIWGLDQQLGSLDVGKMANVVVANGDPLDVKTDVKHVFIAGEEIPLVNKQTELRDRYWH
jgi:imidazolonepropionase-like amidohydrolase